MTLRSNSGKIQLRCWVLAAFVLIAAVIVHPVRWDPHMRLSRTGVEGLELGASIALHGSFSDPFSTLATGPSAHETPGYPALAAVIIDLFGVGPEGDYALHWVTKIAVAMQLALLPVLAEYWGLNALTGVLAAAVWLFAGFPLLPWEGDFASLLIVILGFPMYRAFRNQLSPSMIAATGIVWGLLLLLTPTPLFVLGLWLIGLMLNSPQSRRQIALLAIIPLVMVLPWLVRNYLVFHKPIFLRDNLGLELSLSNNDCAKFSYALNAGPEGCFSNSHPNYSYREARRVASMGEPEYYQLRLREALNWINHNRARFVSLTSERFVAFWFPYATGNLRHLGRPSRDNWITIACTLLSIPGLILIWRIDRVAAGLLGLWLIFFPPIYYLVQFEARYRHPILWATFLPASYVFTVLFSFIADKIASLAHARKLTTDS
ncbi:MAG: hypothetical protein ACLPPV_08860 [Candidatus Korobacteraceae bacterium]